jgi:transcriptional regulator with XRE-family HTH domain
LLQKYQYVGRRIKNERQKYGLSLNDLAKATGLSASFLSLLENGKAAPSLKVLDKLCSYFSIHIATLFEEEHTEELIHIPKKKQIEVETENERCLRFLLPKAQAFMEPVLITLYPNAANQEPTVHKGVEFGYILEGVIEIHLAGKEPLICKEGDSLIYAAHIPHKLVNPTPKIAKGLWVGLPETETLTTQTLRVADQRMS